MFDVIQTTPADTDTLTRFLCSVFRISPAAPFVAPELMQWKFYAPMPGFTGSRSFVLKADGEIVAHVAVWPSRFVTARSEVPAMHLIDWAASPDVPGAGYLLVLGVQDMVPARIGVGGGDASRALSDRTMKRYGDLDTFARVVRPFAQFRNYPERNWKTPLRLVRNTAWALTALPVTSGNWTAVPIARFDERQVRGFPAKHRSFTPFKRTAAELNYLLECPTVRTSGFLLEKRGRGRGYFLISQPGPQARIAGLYIDSDEVSDWTHAYGAASSIAGTLEGAHEIVAAASTEIERTAILANGFRLRQHVPVWLRDPGGCFSGEPGLQVSFLDGDAAYNHSPAYPYLT